VISVLIVDDDKLARKGLISIMPWSAHDMIVAGEAANGAKALEFLEQHAVDLMFVDLSMPVMSGMELIQATRKKYPNLKEKNTPSFTKALTPKKAEAEYLSCYL